MGGKAAKITAPKQGGPESKEITGSWWNQHPTFSERILTNGGRGRIVRTPPQGKKEKETRRDKNGEGKLPIYL